ncbi:hypothetical protein BLNAU_7982 [Blattamonas nauphoetae]|uniref:Uncharacterized protein n=1 Tax=Blattamonas nauphoetae TaxID=2049346 RepID=A0ABQ9Y083_9EUKA|nr:hypothetical protein BLNAU_7982 [Blattamonas nauphoetae]
MNHTVTSHSSQNSQRIMRPTTYSRSRSVSPSIPVKTWQFWYYSKDNIERLPPSRKALVVRPNDERRARRLEQERNELSSAYDDYERHRKFLNRQQTRSQLQMRMTHNIMKEDFLGTVSPSRTLNSTLSSTSSLANDVSSPVFSSGANTPLPDRGAKRIQRRRNQHPHIDDTLSPGLSFGNQRRTRYNEDIVSSMDQLDQFDRQLKITRKQTKRIQEAISANERGPELSLPYSDPTDGPPLPNYRKAEKFRGKLRKMEREQDVQSTSKQE